MFVVTGNAFIDALLFIALVALICWVIVTVIRSIRP